MDDVLKIALHALDSTTDRALISLLPPSQVFTVQLLYRPLTVLVWIGAFLVALGGFLAMTRPVKRAKDKLRVSEPLRRAR